MVEVSIKCSTLIIGPSVKELIAAGWLCEFIVCAPERIVDLKRVRTLGGDYQLNELLSE